MENLPKEKHWVNGKTNQFSLGPFQLIHMECIFKTLFNSTTCIHFEHEIKHNLMNFGAVVVTPFVAST